jgi:hypothetical protein
MPDTKKILKALRDELTLQTRHRKLLEAQEQALLTCNRTRFATLQEEYVELLLLLEAQDTARKSVLIDDKGEPLTLSMLKEFLPPNRLRDLEEGLRRTLEQVQTLTCRNQILIQNELKYLAFTLDLFVEAGRNADTGYGPQSRDRSGWQTGRLLLDRRA